MEIENKISTEKEKNKRKEESSLDLELEEFEHLEKEDKGVFKKAFQNLRSYGIPVELPTDVKIVSKDKKSDQSENYQTEGVYYAHNDELVVHKDYIKEESLFEGYVDGELEGGQEVNRSKMEEKLTAMIRNIRSEIEKSEMKEESYIPKELLENIKNEEPQIALFEVLTKMDILKLKSSLDLFMTSEKQNKLKEIFRRREQEVIEHELLHKLDMDIISSPESQLAAELSKNLEDSIEKYIKDIEKLGFLDESEDDDGDLSNHMLIHPDVRKSSMIIDIMGDENYREMLGKAREKHKKSNAEEGYVATSALRHIRHALIDVYYDHKEDILKKEDLIIERYRTAKEDYPENLSEARNQVWDSFRNEELDSQKGIESLKRRVSFYGDRSEEIERYVNMLLDIYKETEGSKEEKIKNVLFGAEDMIYQTITEKMKQEIFKN